MHTQTKLSFTTLLLLISFASVNAVLFTPALPDIAHFFFIDNEMAQQTITLFLVGYALGQLLYGPIANRFGRKPALYAGISLQIISSLLCVFSGIVHEFLLLIIGRFLLALGAGVGLKMTFTLVNECYEPKIASQKIAYLTLAFAITPGLSIALGGILNTYFGWQSCFYAGLIYGLILLYLTTRLPETQKKLEMEALKIPHLINQYAKQFKNTKLVSGGLLLGLSSCFVYIFATIAPFIAMNKFAMSSSEYGFANIIPTLGLIAGSLTNAHFVKKYSCQSGMQLGILITALSAVLMLIAVLTQKSALVALFIPLTFIYFGISFLFTNASTFAMSNTDDKAHGAAVMSFMNMGLVTMVVINLGLLPMVTLALPFFYLILSISMIGLYTVNIR